MSELTLKQEEELTRLKIHLDSLRHFITQKSAIIPVVASLSATVLVVATFNKDILPITHDLKVVLSVLLILIPISIIISVFEYHIAINSTEKAITGIVGDIRSKMKKRKRHQKIFDHVLAYYPFLGVFILTIAITYIVLAIWKVA